MQKRGKTIFIIVFFAIISLQFVAFFLMKGFVDTANYENRNLTTFNDVLTAPPQKKAAAFEKLLNDNAPFKNQYLKLNAFINYKFFGTVQSNEVLLGKNQWLFYKNVSDSKSLDDYQGLNPYSAAQMESIGQAVTQLNEILAQKGTKLYLLIAPNKEQVYSRFMPDSVPQIASSRADLLVDYLNTNTQATVVYPKKLLTEQSEKQQVYYKYDTHWNNAGALLAVKQISSAFENCTAQPAEGEPLQDLAYLSSLYSILPKDNYYEISGIPNKTGQSLTMFHDSFGYTMVPLLEKAYETNFNNFSQFDPKVILKKSDIVVVETSERFLDNLLPRIESMIAAFNSENG